MDTPLCDAWRLPDGQLMVIRGGVRADLPAVEDFISHLSTQSRYRRFFYPAHELTAPMQRQFTRSNPKVEMSLLAVVLDGDGHETLVGTAQYAVSHWPDEADFAVVVADDWQRRGIARRLLRDLLGVASVSGLHSMHGDVLADNEPMRRLLLQLGFEFQRHPDGPLLRRAVKTLDGFAAQSDCPVLAEVGKLARSLRTPAALMRV